MEIRGVTLSSPNVIFRKIKFLRLERNLALIKMEIQVLTSLLDAAKKRCYDGLTQFHGPPISYADQLEYLKKYRTNPGLIDDQGKTTRS